MPTPITLPDILQGEARAFEFSYPAGQMPAGADGWDYRLGLAETPDGDELLGVAFGPGQYDAGRGVWTVTLTADQTAALPVGDLYAAAWRSGLPQALRAWWLACGKLVGRPG